MHHLKTNYIEDFPRSKIVIWQRWLDKMWVTLQLALQVATMIYRLRSESLVCPSLILAISSQAVEVIENRTRISLNTLK